MLRGCRTTEEQTKVQSKGGHARMAKYRKNARLKRRLSLKMRRAARLRWGWPEDLA